MRGKANPRAWVAAIAAWARRLPHGWHGSVLLAVASVCYFPLVIYGENADFIEQPLAWYLVPQLLLAAGLVAALQAFGSALPARARPAFQGAIAGLAVYFWIGGALLVRKLGLLTGEALKFDFSLGAMAADAALLIVLVAGGAALPARFRPARSRFAAGLALLLVLHGAWIAFTTESNAGQSSVNAGLESVAAFSPERNVFIVLMDTFQSDIFAEILEEEPALRESLDGFEYFPEAMGVAPTTAVSLPAILSGVEYDPSLSLSEYYNSTIPERSILARSARLGYDVVHLNPIGVCPSGARVCERSDNLMRDVFDGMGNRLFLVDLALLRAAPLALKRHVYADGDFLVTRALSGLEPFQRIGRRHAYFLDRFAEALTPNSAAPTVKFLHMMNTHLPVVLDANCGFTRWRKTRWSFKGQARCGVRTFLAILAAMRKTGVHDNSMIVLLADHGARLSRNGVPGSFEDTPFGRLAGGASPLLLVKARNAHGPLRLNEAPVQLTDLPATLCADIPGCEGIPGTPLGRWRAGDTRRRVYHHYFWNDDYWKRGSIPGLVTFAVEGRHSDPAAWRRADGQPRDARLFAPR